MSATAILPSIFTALRPSTIDLHRSSRRRPAAARRSSLYFGSIARSSVIAENLPLWSMRTARLSLRVTFSSIQLPRSGMMRQLCSRRSPPFHLADEVDAGAAVQLADHHPLGAVDDELAAAEHDRHVAQVDFFLDRLLLGQAEPDLERAGRRSAATGGTRRARSAACPVRSGGTPGAASCRSSRSGRSRAARLPSPGPSAFARRTSYCRNVGVAAGLDLASDRGSHTARPQTAEMADFLGLKTPLSRGSHEGSPS